MNYWMIGPNLVAAILYSKGEILFTLLIFSCCPKYSMVWKRRALSLREFQVQTPYSNFHSETLQLINHRNHWSNNCVIHQTQTLGTPAIFTIIIAWTSSSTFSKSLRHTQHCGVNNKKKHSITLEYLENSPLQLAFGWHLEKMRRLPVLLRGLRIRAINN